MTALSGGERSRLDVIAICDTRTDRQTERQICIYCDGHTPRYAQHRLGLMDVYSA